MIHAIIETAFVAFWLFGLDVIFRSVAPPPRNHHAKHSHGDEHAEGWAVGGGFINHGSVE